MFPNIFQKLNLFTYFLPFSTNTTSENILAKGEITHNEQFPLLAKCFQLYSIITQVFIFKRFSMFLPRHFQSCLLQNCYYEYVWLGKELMIGRLWHMRRRSSNRTVSGVRRNSCGLTLRCIYYKVGKMLTVLTFLYSRLFS